MLQFYISLHFISGWPEFGTAKRPACTLKLRPVKFSKCTCPLNPGEKSNLSLNQIFKSKIIILKNPTHVGAYNYLNLFEPNLSIFLGLVEQV